MTPLPPNWWPLLSAWLTSRQNHPGYIVTRTNGVWNYVLLVDQVRGFVRLRSKLSPTGASRDITKDMIEWPENTHGVIRRDLRHYAVMLCMGLTPP